MFNPNTLAVNQFVYGCLCLTEPGSYLPDRIKYGRSHDPEQRVRKLHGMNPDSMQMLDVVAFKGHEREIHRMFESHRRCVGGKPVKREWFDYCEEIERFNNRMLLAQGLPPFFLTKLKEEMRKTKSNTATRCVVCKRWRADAHIVGDRCETCMVVKRWNKW